MNYIIRVTQYEHFRCQSYYEKKLIGSKLKNKNKKKLKKEPKNKFAAENGYKKLEKKKFPITDYPSATEERDRLSFASIK